MTEKERERDEKRASERESAPARERERERERESKGSNWRSFSTAFRPTPLWFYDFRYLGTAKWNNLA